MIKIHEFSLQNFKGVLSLQTKTQRMLIILSPSKTMVSPDAMHHYKYSLPEYLGFTKHLAEILRKKSPSQLSKLMKINPELAQLNFERFQQWELPFDGKNATPAVFSYTGEVFRGLEASSLKKTDVSFAQDHLRILSGFYGVLRPLDLILPYRLEMGQAGISAGKAKNLYDFWRPLITSALNKAFEIQKDDVLINLASNEYFKSIDKKALHARVITPVFKEYKNGKAVIVTMYAKKARGMMTRFMIQNKLTKPDELKLFDAEGYYYAPDLSNDREMTFTR